MPIPTHSPITVTVIDELELTEYLNSDSNRDFYLSSLYEHLRELNLKGEDLKENFFHTELPTFLGYYPLKKDTMLVAVREENFTPFELFCLSGKLDALKALSLHPSVIQNAAKKNEYRAIKLAAENGHKQLAEYLLTLLDEEEKKKAIDACKTVEVVRALDDSHGSIMGTISVFLDETVRQYLKLQENENTGALLGSVLASALGAALFLALGGVSITIGMPILFTVACFFPAFLLAGMSISVSATPVVMAAVNLVGDKIDANSNSNSEITLEESKLPNKVEVSPLSLFSRGESDKESSTCSVPPLN